MIQRLPAPLGGLDEDLQIVCDGLLADIVIQCLRAEADFLHFFAGLELHGCDAFSDFHMLSFISPPALPDSAARFAA